MTEINEVISCDGTCGLSPAEHEQQHPHPMTVLRAAMVDAARGLDAENAVDAVLAQLEDHPTLTIRHYAPTRDAYDAACAALENHRKRADAAEKAIEEIKRLHGKPRTERYGSGCVQCGILWPCPTARAVGIKAPKRKKV